ncbi:membrane protein [soil metagenome]
MTTRPSSVPPITALFWAAKIVTTGMGETTSDFFVRLIAPEVAVGVAAVLLAVALVLQFRARRYVPAIYWITVALVSVFGTMVADVAHIALGIPYVISTIVFALVLTVVFVAWKRTEGTLSIHSITSRRREVFYWLTVVSTFALGTAAGDLTATVLGLGYLASGILFALLFVVPIVWVRVGLSRVAAFWIAYVLTRPLGASFADWAGVPPERHGLDLGTGPVSLVLAVVLAVLVTTMTIRDRRTDQGRSKPITVVR